MSTGWGLRSSKRIYRTIAQFTAVLIIFYCLKYLPSKINVESGRPIQSKISSIHSHITYKTLPTLREVAEQHILPAQACDERSTDLKFKYSKNPKDIQKQISKLLNWQPSQCCIDRLNKVTPVADMENKLLIHFIHMYPAVHDPKKLCPIESLLRFAIQNDQNIEIQIHTSNVTNMKDVLYNVSKSPLVKIVPLNVTDLLECTILRQWYRIIEPKAFNDFKNQDIANALRLAIVAKHGGLYLDLDIVTTTPRFVQFVMSQRVSVFWSQSAKSLDQANNAIIYAPRGDRFIQKLMNEFVMKYKHGIWSHNGPRRVQGAMSICSRHPELKCGEVKVMPLNGSRSFEYNFFVNRFKKDFSPKNSDWKIIQEKVFFVHWFNHMFSQAKEKCWPPKSMIAELFRTYCPRVTELYSADIICTS